MPVVRLTVLAPDAVAEWRAAREASGSLLPEADGAERLDALEIVVDGVAVGGLVLTFAGTRATIRLVETTLPADAGEAWAAVLGAVDEHAGAGGATTITTAVPPAALAPFRDAGYLATMTGVAVDLADSGRVLPDDGRVAVRPMTAAERAVFAREAAGFMREGMERAGVLPTAGAPMDELDRRLAGLVEDPPPAELLLTATLRGEPIGRFWATLEQRDGRVDLAGHTIDLFPEHRGQGLTRPFMAAIETYARDHGLREVTGRVYGHDVRARTTLVEMGLGVDDVHLRKDLGDYPLR
jgi:GNAT superfamily N-acetyltransferase